MATGALVPKLIGTFSGVVVGTMLPAGLFVAAVQLDLHNSGLNLWVGMLALFFLGSIAGGVRLQSTPLVIR